MLALVLKSLLMAPVVALAVLVFVTVVAAPILVGWAFGMDEITWWLFAITLLWTCALVSFVLLYTEH